MASTAINMKQKGLKDFKKAQKEKALAKRIAAANKSKSKKEAGVEIKAAPVTAENKTGHQAAVFQNITTQDEVTGSVETASNVVLPGKKDDLEKDRDCTIKDITIVAERITPDAPDEDSADLTILNGFPEDNDIAQVDITGDEHTFVDMITPAAPFDRDQYQLDFEAALRSDNVDEALTRLNGFDANEAAYAIPDLNEEEHQAFWETIEAEEKLYNFGDPLDEQVAVKPTYAVDDNDFTPLIMPASWLTEPATDPSPTVEQLFTKVREAGIPVIGSSNPSISHTVESIEQAADPGAPLPTNTPEPAQASQLTINDLFSSVVASGPSIIRLSNKIDSKPIPVAHTLQSVEASMVSTTSNTQPTTTPNNDPAIWSFKIATDTTKPQQLWQPTHHDLALTSALQAGTEKLKATLGIGGCHQGQDLKLEQGAVKIKTMLGVASPTSGSASTRILSRSRTSSQDTVLEQGANKIKAMLGVAPPSSGPTSTGSVSRSRTSSEGTVLEQGADKIKAMLGITTSSSGTASTTRSRTSSQGTTDEACLLHLHSSLHRRRCWLRSATPMSTPTMVPVRSCIACRHPV